MKAVQAAHGHTRKVSDLSVVSDENHDLHVGQQSDSSPGRGSQMYYNRDTQRWEGGEEVDLSGFESDGDDEESQADASPMSGRGFIPGPGVCMSPLQLPLKDRETLASIDNGRVCPPSTGFSLKGSAESPPPRCSSGPFHFIDKSYSDTAHTVQPPAQGATATAGIVHFNPMTQRWEGTSDVDLSGFDSDSEQLEGGSPPRSRSSLPPDDSSGLVTTPLPLPPNPNPNPRHRSTSVPRTPSSLGRTEAASGGLNFKRLPSTSAWAEVGDEEEEEEEPERRPQHRRGKGSGSGGDDSMTGLSRSPRKPKQQGQDDEGGGGGGAPTARLRVGGSSGGRHSWLLAAERRKDSYDSISSRDFDFEEGTAAPPVHARVMEEVGYSSSGDSVDGFGDGHDDEEGEGETTFLTLTAQDDEVEAARSGPPVLINIKPIGLSATHSRALLRQASGVGGEGGPGGSKMFYNAEQQRWEGEEVDLTGFESEDDEEAADKKGGTAEGGGASHSTALGVPLAVVSLTGPNGDSTGTGPSTSIATTRLVVAASELDKEQARQIAAELAQCFDADFDEGPGSLLHGQGLDGSQGRPLPALPKLKTPSPPPHSLLPDASLLTPPAALEALSHVSFGPSSPPVPTPTEPHSHSHVRQASHKSTTSHAKTLGPGIGPSGSKRRGPLCVKDRLGSGWYTLGTCSQPLAKTFNPFSSTGPHRDRDRELSKRGAGTGTGGPHRRTLTSGPAMSGAGAGAGSKAAAKDGHHVRLAVGSKDKEGATRARDTASAPPRQRVCGGGSEDFVLPSEVRRVFLRCEEEHENDMKAFLGNRLFAKAQRIGVERFASHQHSRTGVDEQQEERAPSGKQKRGLSTSGGGGGGAKEGSLDSSLGLGQPQGLSTSAGGRLGSTSGSTSGSLGREEDKSKASTQRSPGGAVGSPSTSGLKSSTLVRRRPSEEGLASSRGVPGAQRRPSPAKPTSAQRQSLSASLDTSLRQRLFQPKPSTSTARRPTATATATAGAGSGSRGASSTCQGKGSRHAWQHSGPVVATSPLLARSHTPRQPQDTDTPPRHDPTNPPQPHTPGKMEKTGVSTVGSADVESQEGSHLAQLSSLAWQKGWHLAPCLTEAQLSRMVSVAWAPTEPDRDLEGTATDITPQQHLKKGASAGAPPVVTLHVDLTTRK